MSYPLAGKRVLVTGASSGIGATLAVGFAQHGATVGICARRADRLADVLAQCQEHAPDSRSWTVDLADLDGISAFVGEVHADFGEIDVLVNNAGIPKRRRVDALTPDVVESVMALNYFSPVRLTLAFLPELIARQGRIVNVSSVAARLGPPGEAAYAASKAALTAFSEGMAADLAERGVKVLIVNPGVIDTELFHLPDNDASVADIEALPTTAMVQPVIDALDAGLIEINVPEWFHDIFVSKFQDPTAFLAATVAWSASKQST